MLLQKLSLQPKQPSTSYSKKQIDRAGKTFISRDVAKEKILVKEKDIYDIIIENIVKECYNFMINQTEEFWEQPQYSKNKIDKAGKILANKNISQEETEQALTILNNWRSSHAYPLSIMANSLTNSNPNAIVVQRLKRLDSIVGKLERFPQMSLYKMQDLGGCRVILDTIDQVYESVSNYKLSSTSYILKKENDYIQNPKTSGYRSYHIVYQFQSEINEAYNKNILIEIQFRTHLQHLWATALETMGIYTQTALKSSKGDKDVLRFFVLVSSLFALQEGTPVCPDTSDDSNKIIVELKEIDSRLNIVSKLNAISTATAYSNRPSNESKGYYLLLLDFVKRELKIAPFLLNQIEAATKSYNQIEALQLPNTDVVLVSASSFDALKKAYPNYFSDISQFVIMMRELL